MRAHQPSLRNGFQGVSPGQHPSARQEHSPDRQPTRRQCRHSLRTQRFRSHFGVRPRCSVGRRARGLCGVRTGRRCRRSGRRTGIRSSRNRGRTVSRRRAGVCIRSRNTGCLRDLLRAFVIELQELISPETEGDQNRRNADPQGPVELAGGFDPHRLTPLRIESPVERRIGRKMFEFEHADALDRQHAVFERAGQPAVVYILRFGGVALHGAGDFSDQRHAPLLRGKRHGPARRQHAPPRNAPRAAAFRIERSHTRQEHLSAPGEQVAYETVDLVYHRIITHFFFFLAVAAGDFGTTGTTSGCVAPR